MLDFFQLLFLFLISFNSYSDAWVLPTVIPMPDFFQLLFQCLISFSSYSDAWLFPILIPMPDFFRLLFRRLTSSDHPSHPSQPKRHLKAQNLIFSYRLPKPPQPDYTVVNEHPKAQNSLSLYRPPKSSQPVYRGEVGHRRGFGAHFPKMISSSLPRHQGGILRHYPRVQGTSK